MSDYTPLTMAQYAHRLSVRAERLCRLIELKAPGFIIETERNLCVKAALDIPIDEVQREAHRCMDAQIRDDELKALDRAGFFAQIDEQQRQMEQGKGSE